MDEEKAKPWLGSTTDCPVRLGVQNWIESSIYWMIQQFGTEVLYRDPTLPTAGFLLAAEYSNSADGIQALVSYLCRLMMVDRDRVTLQLFDGSAEAERVARLGGKRTVGHFEVLNGRAIIALDESQASDPKIMTAIAVHELCHQRLLGEGRISREQPDGERLTDLLTVYFGFGIFCANAAMHFARADRGWTIVSRGLLDDRELNAARRHDGYSRIGYLSSEEFGYALACYAWLRHEPAPDWTRYLNPGPRIYQERGLAHLTQTRAIG